MRCPLSGNDFCEGPEAKRCHAHPSDRLVLSTSTRNILGGGGFPHYAFHIIVLPAGAPNGPSLRFGIRRRAFCDAIK